MQRPIFFMVGSRALHKSGMGIMMRYMSVRMLRTRVVKIFRCDMAGWQESKGQVRFS